MKRKNILLAAFVALSLHISAQQRAVRVESPIVTEKDFVWYVEQKEAWKNVIENDPTNEEAWMN